MEQYIFSLEMGQQVSVNKSFVPGVAASSALYVSMLSPSATQTKESTAAGPVRGGVCMCMGGGRRGKTERGRGRLAIAGSR